MNKGVESLYYMPEINLTCDNYAQIKDHNIFMQYMLIIFKNSGIDGILEINHQGIKILIMNIYKL